MSFFERLDSIYNILEEEKRNEGKLILPQPNIEVTTTNTFWHNVKDFLRAVNRPPVHFIEFLGDQLNTEVTQKSSSLKKGLILKGKQKKQKVTPIIEKYVKECVLCQYCSSYNTKIKKDSNIRKYILTCRSCNSSYSI
tara:strand:+ start:1546 stop:1959 length:414 start_codon:yes stop_codon:yes gene_type:complete